MSLAGFLRNALLFRTLPKRDSVILFGRGELFIDTGDNRGRSILQNAGMTQPFTALLWRNLVSRLDPEIVLDIGANYGEIALSSTYSAGTQIHLFEPNPYVRTYLEKSVSTRRDSQNIRLHPELVGSQVGQQTFVVDRKWSGTSSAVGEISGSDGIKGDGAEHFEEITVASTTIDASLANAGVPAKRRLLFKIDVEGYEGHVLAGMKGTLRNAAAYAGIVEFDRDYLRRAGTDPEAMLRELSDLGVVSGVFGNQIFNDVDGLPGHFDLLVASSASVLADIGDAGMMRHLFRRKGS